MNTYAISALANRLSGWFPGLLLSATIAVAAKFLADFHGAPVMLMALLLGMAFNFLSENARCRPGIDLSSRTLLRAGIVLLGARISIEEVARIGAGGVLAVAGFIVLTIGCGFICARLFSRGWRFALLTGGAVAICGASAALAIASVIPHNDKTERNVLFTVVAVTSLSTIAMILYPLLFTLAGLSDAQSGFLLGATIHDVAQVVGAGYSISTEAGDLATIVKLLRVALLPLVLIVIALSVSSGSGTGKAIGMPFFVIGFVVLAMAGSLDLLPAPVVALASDASSWLLVVAIAALGIKTNLKAMLDLGWRHFAVVTVETLFLLGLAFAAVSYGLAG